MTARRVLVVDDDAAIRGLLDTLLTFEGYEVHTAPDGASALRAIPVVEPDCVVLDLMMPAMSGFDVLAAIRTGPQTAQLPVLMLTAAFDDENAWGAWQRGVDYFLPKPFEVQHLLGWLDGLFAADAAPRGCVDVERVLRLP